MTTDEYNAKIDLYNKQSAAAQAVAEDSTQALMARAAALEAMSECLVGMAELLSAAMRGEVVAP